MPNPNPTFSKWAEDCYPGELAITDTRWIDSLTRGWWEYLWETDGTEFLRELQALNEENDELCGKLSHLEAERDRQQGIVIALESGIRRAGRIADSLPYTAPELVDERIRILTEALLEALAAGRKATTDGE